MFGSLLSLLIVVSVAVDVQTSCDVKVSDMYHDIQAVPVTLLDRHTFDGYCPGKHALPACCCDFWPPLVPMHSLSYPSWDYPTGSSMDVISLDPVIHCMTQSASYLLPTCSEHVNLPVFVAYQFCMHHRSHQKRRFSITCYTYVDFLFLCTVIFK